MTTRELYMLHALTQLHSRSIFCAANADHPVSFAEFAPAHTPSRRPWKLVAVPRTLADPKAGHGAKRARLAWWLWWAAERIGAGPRVLAKPLKSD